MSCPFKRLLKLVEYPWVFFFFFLQIITGICHFQTQCKNHIWYWRRKVKALTHSWCHQLWYSCPARPHRSCSRWHPWRCLPDRFRHLPCPRCPRGRHCYHETPAASAEVPNTCNGPTRCWWSGWRSPAEDTHFPSTARRLPAGEGWTAPVSTIRGSAVPSSWGYCGHLSQ